MDGLTIRNSDSFIKTGDTLREIRDSKIRNEVTSPEQAPAGSFADTLKEAVNTVNQLQKDSDRKMEDLATGKAKSIPDVMIAAEKADIALKLMVQVRNKVIEAYQEVMKMQV